MSAKSIQEAVWQAYRDASDIAVLRQQVEEHRWLLDVPSADQSLLQRAIESHDVSAAKLLLDMGEKPNKHDGAGFSFVITAVSLSDECEQEATTDIVRALASVGADLNYCGSSGYRPLHWAAHRNQSWLIELLVELGADIDGRMSVDGELTPLMVACGMRNSGAATTLKKLGADEKLKTHPSLSHGGGLTAADLGGDLGIELRFFRP